MASDPTETILIVDDERPIRRILSVLLKEHHYRVIDVGSGEEAVAALPRIEEQLRRWAAKTLSFE